MARRKKSKDEAEPSGDARSFEEVYEQLESIVSELESGELPLERALERFEVGLTDYRRCIDILEGVERRVELLSAKSGEASKPMPGYEGDATGSGAEGEEE